VSPFEPIPDLSTDMESEEEMLRTASARILRLEEQVARLQGLLSPNGPGHEGDEQLHAVP
jgi:hypothetical protein